MFSSTSRSAPVSEMETSRVALIALVCVVFSGQKRISGAEVETRVRRGDDVTLYSDCVVKRGLYPVSLLIKNVSESDQGVYYCALSEKKVLDNNIGVTVIGNRSTRLSVLEEVTVSPNTPTLCVSERSVGWNLVLGVCAVCVLLSSHLSSICVYCLCTNTTNETEAELAGSDKRTTVRLKLRSVMPRWTSRT
ncbi:hypothetical protein AMELA_G00177410 [Ameiurus melas]|uniref:Immunoglobulin subtype domain-containing protein n=1 Tax=Ameiurus melas TaxID=219545 RepID=A0A7J6A915_AMEME|nr:hypothetical protein AMELA_G00177410 [Ameiurus melas]